MNQSLAGAPTRARKAGFLQRLVSLTEERDLDMLERSMLITICEVLHPGMAALYRQLAKGQPALAMVCNDRGACRVEELEDAPSFGDFSSKPDTVIFPIPGKQDILGYVLVQRDTAVSEDERIMVDGLLRIYNNFLSVLEESQRDQLTGLFNRRIFEQRFQGLLTDMINENALSKDTDRKPVTPADTVWLGLIDIDNFKQINDTYGHLYGDEVLILVARFMLGAFRENDLVFRFGGEEFAVMLQAPDKESARVSFERLCRSLRNHMFPQVGRVTVSVGVTGVVGEPVPAMLVGKADSALYYAKRNGKNQVVFFDDLPESEKPKAPVVEDDIELF